MTWAVIMALLSGILSLAGDPVIFTAKWLTESHLAADSCTNSA